MSSTETKIANHIHTRWSRGYSHLGNLSNAHQLALNSLKLPDARDELRLACNQISDTHVAAVMYADVYSTSSQRYDRFLHAVVFEEVFEWPEQAVRQLFMKRYGSELLPVVHDLASQARVADKDDLRDTITKYFVDLNDVEICRPDPPPAALTAIAARSTASGTHAEVAGQTQPTTTEQIRTLGEQVKEQQKKPATARAAITVFVSVFLGIIATYIVLQKVREWEDARLVAEATGGKVVDLEDTIAAQKRLINELTDERDETRRELATVRQDWLTATQERANFKAQSEGCTNSVRSWKSRAETSERELLVSQERVLKLEDERDTWKRDQIVCARRREALEGELRSIILDVEAYKQESLGCRSDLELYKARINCAMDDANCRVALGLCYGAGPSYEKR